MESQEPQKEFRINEHLTLKLEGGKTHIYVGGERFFQCKYLFLLNPQGILNEINSVDEAAEVFDKAMESRLTPDDLGLTLEEVFWGHCSNLQAWAEHDYDARLLHSNLSIPLLRELKKLGDPLAIRVYKESLLERFLQGPRNTQEFLLPYMEEDISHEEKLSLIQSREETQVIRKIEQLIGEELELDTYYHHWDKSFFIRGGRVLGISLMGTSLKRIPEEIKAFPLLEVFYFKSKSLTEVPEWISELKTIRKLAIILSNIRHFPRQITNLAQLEYLNLSGNPFTSFPEEISRLTALKELYHGGPIKNLSKGFGELASLKKLKLYNAQIATLPESFGKLKNLETLIMRNGALEQLPESFGELDSLKTLILADNRKLKRLPDSFGNLKNLETLNMESCALEELPRSFSQLPLKYANLAYNRLGKDPANIGDIEKLILVGNETPNPVPDAFKGF